MTLVHEVPTHLNVEDTLIFGLTPRQLLRIAVGATLAYATWDQTGGFPDGLRFGVAAALVVFGLLLGFVQPAGRPLDQWLFAALLFLALPRRRVWRLMEGRSRAERTSNALDWAELSPLPEWLGRAEGNQRPIQGRPLDRQPFEWPWHG